MVPTKKYKYSQTSYHLYVVLINFSKLKIERPYLMNTLKKYSIGTMVHYIPLHYQPAYSNIKNKDLKCSEEYFDKCLSLSLHTNMKKKDVIYVVQMLKNIINKYKN